MALAQVPYLGIEAGHARGEVCVIVVLSAPEERISECERSLRDHTDAAVPSGRVAPQAAAINELLAQLAPADVVLLSEPCAVGPGWLERLRAAARADTNTATASALVDVGGPLALVRADRSQEEIVRPGPGGAHEHAPALRPRLNRPSGPCV